MCFLLNTDKIKFLSIKLAVNNDNESVVDGEDIEDFDERITFSIDDTPAFTTVTIIGEKRLVSFVKSNVFATGRVGWISGILTLHVKY